MPVSLPLRRLTAAAVLACALLAVPAAARADVRSDANALRARAGLAPLTGSDPTAARIAAQIASAPVADTDECRCLLPDNEEAAASRMFGDVWAARTGAATADDAQPAASGPWNPAASLAANTTQHPELLALLLDPRARTLDVAAGRYGGVIAVTVNRAIRFTTPFAVPDGPIDPLGSRPARWVAPATDGGYDVQARYAGGWETIAPGLYDDLGGVHAQPTGAAVVAPEGFAYETTPPFAASLRLRVAGGALSGETRTAPLRPALRRASFRFGKGMTGARRRAFKSAVRRSRPATRRMLAVIDGMTRVRIARPESGEAGSAGDYGSGWQIKLSPSWIHLGRDDRDAVVLHELGHVIDRSGLRDDPAGRRIDKTIPRRGKCPKWNPKHPAPEAVSLTGSCALPAERFADTFAKWALRLRSLRNVGYSVPAPRSFARFERALRRAWTLAPVAAPGNPYD